MADVVVAIMTVVAGALLCVRGCAAIRVAVPAGAFVAAFLLGAGLVQATTDSTLLGTATSWVVGLASGAPVGAAAWMWFEVAVAVAFAAVGYSATVATLAATDAGWSWWKVALGAAVGLTLGLLCVVADLPSILLTVLTAVAGAATVVTGLVLLGNSIGVADLASADTLGRIPTRAACVAAWLLLSLLGVGVQARTTPRVTLRDRFVDAGGRQLRET